MPKQLGNLAGLDIQHPEERDEIFCCCWVKLHLGNRHACRRHLKAFESVTFGEMSRTKYGENWVHTEPGNAII